MKITVKFEDRRGYFLVSESGKEYEIVYGKAIGAECTNDIAYIMSMEEDQPPRLVYWFFGVPDLDLESERESMTSRCGREIEEYEKEFCL